MNTYTQKEIEDLREKLRDYYGSASGLFPLAMADLVRLESMNDEEIIKEAEKLRLI